VRRFIGLQLLRQLKCVQCRFSLPQQQKGLTPKAIPDGRQGGQAGHLLQRLQSGEHLLCTLRREIVGELFNFRGEIELRL